MKVNIKISYNNEEHTFENVELDNHRLLQFETIHEAAVDDFYSNFSIDEIIDVVTGKEL